MKNEENNKGTEMKNAKAAKKMEIASRAIDRAYNALTAAMKLGIDFDTVNQIQTGLEKAESAMWAYKDSMKQGSGV